MRIATSTMYQRAVDAINDRQAQLARSQEELSGGRKLLRPSDDPGAAAEAERLRAQTARLDLAQRMNGFARGVIAQTESTLAQVDEMVQSLREYFVQAGNGTLSASDRSSLAIQIRSERDELLRLANRTDGAGGHLFGGLGTAHAPFSNLATYDAVPGAQEVGLDATVPTSIDGREVFLAVPTSGTPGSLFALLDTAIATLDDPAATGAQVRTAVEAGLDVLDGALDRVLAKRTEAGIHLALIDSREALSENDRLAIAARLSELVDTDYAKSASDLARHETVLQAALKTYASIGRLSLFDQM